MWISRFFRWLFGVSQTTITNVAPDKIVYAGKIGSIHSGLDSVDPNGYDGWNGDCPGCVKDAKTMASLSRDNGSLVHKILLNSDSTITRFIAECKLLSASVPKDGLVIITWSGHGGQVPDLNGDEPDGLDETICLWDGQLIDDLMYEALKTFRKGQRVFMFADTCHSQSAIRGVSTIRKSIEKAVDKGIKARILFFAGCEDESYSYGSANGGEFTNMASDEFIRGMTWRKWFDIVHAKMPSKQKPTMMEIGESFIDECAFCPGFTPEK